MDTKVLELAKERNGTGPGSITLSTGIKATLVAVPSMLIEEAQASIPDAPVPVQEIANVDQDGKPDGTTRTIENPAHPDYPLAQKEVMRKRSQAAIDTMIMFGVELALPKDKAWLSKLQFMEKVLGHIDLSKFDLEAQMDQEFLYKKYIAMGSDDWFELGRLSGISQEAIDKVKESTFQGN